MSNQRRKNRWRRNRGASNLVEKHATPALPAVWVPLDENHDLKVAARGTDTIGYPMCPPAPIRFAPPGRSRC